MKDVLINTSRLRLAVSIHQPRQQAKTAAILCPGYLDSRNYPHLISLANALAKVGILALRLDPIGTWDSEGTEADYTLSSYLQSITVAENYARHMYHIEKVLVAGHSFGDYASLIYASQQPMSGTAALCSPKQLPSALKWETGVRHSTRALPSGQGTRSFAVPQTFAEDAKKYSVADAVRSYSATPLLLIAGSEDDAVSLAEVKDVYDAAHEPKSFVLLEGIDHDFRKNRQDTQKVTDTVIGWAMQHALNS